MPKFILTILCFFILYLSKSQSVYINEICSSNSTTLQDQDGDFSDWIELYNNSENEISLLGYYLSDDIDNKNKWSFPDVLILPKSYLIIFASSKDKNINNEIHTNFKISKSGEEIILTNSNDSIVSFVPAIEIPTDYSYSRIELTNFEISNTPTPLVDNQQSLLVNNSHPSGFYTTPFQLELTHTHNDYHIRYTTNGNEPNENSLIYSNPIEVVDNSEKDYSYSSIPTTPQVDNWPLSQFIWKEPLAVNTGTVIRYSLFKGNEKATETETLTFWIDENINDKYSLPVLSLVTDSLHLFDYETGIYIPGKIFDEQGFNWYPTGNYHQKGKEWERPAHISYYSKNGLQQFETNLGIRMKGFGSTSNPQKSMNIFLRKEYGQEQVETDLFNNQEKNIYNRFVMRNSGNDFLQTHFRDGLLQSLINNLDLDLQDFQPAITFVNGEYWGIFNVRENYDKYYFSNKYNLDKDEINILEYCGEIESGSNESYLDLLSFVEENDLSEPGNYQHVQNEIELDNFIDFIITEIYYANFDWPCNNYKVWKPNTAGSKWRFLIYDLDLAFNSSEASDPSTKSLEHATSTLARQWPYCPCSNAIFRNLLENEIFTKKFINRFIYLLENNFKTETVLDKIEEFKAVYQPEMQEHIDRWHYPANVDKWEEEIEVLNDFAIRRPCFMKENIIDFFNLDTLNYNCLPLDSQDLVSNLIVEIHPTVSGGEIKLNSGPEEFRNERLYIYNILGEQVMSDDDFDLRPFQQKTMNLTFLVNGIYTVNLSHQGQIIQQRIIINR